MTQRIATCSGGVPDSPRRTRPTSLPLVAGGMAALFLAACVSTATTQLQPQTTTLRKIEPGVYVAPQAGPDTLLRLAEVPDLRVLVIHDEFAGISDAHIAALRDWVAGGGTVWLDGPGLENPSLQQLVPFQHQPFEFRKTDTGDRGGELIVRGSVDRLQIHDHDLTEGVQQLYVYPEWRFDGTKDLVPLVEMTDHEGVHGTVLGVVSLDEGRVILDGTARTEGGLFSKIPGFDPSHPNAVREGDGWNSYDWGRLMANARELADTSMPDTRSSGR